MTSNSEPGIGDNSERQRIEFDLLVSNIGNELTAQAAIAGREIVDADIAQLAEAIATNVDYAFDFHWAPRWVKAGEPHLWTASQGAFARCNSCLVDSPTLPTRAETLAWFEAHKLGPSHASASPAAP